MLGSATHKTTININMHDDIALITCFFNPLNYKENLSNYFKFKKYITDLNYPLYTAELSFNDNSSQLVNDEYTWKIKTNDILWHKERLLNLISKKVPAKYKKIIWADADISYKDKLWIDKTSESLNQYKIVQPFSKSTYLDRSENILINNRLGSIYGYKNNPKDFRGWNYNSGFVWASRREFFEKFGLFDRGILGGGDAFMAHAFVKNLAFDLYVEKFKWNNDIVRAYLNWALPVIDYVGDSINYLDLEVYHNWHGDLKNRKYVHRTEILKNFNPFTMLKEDENGVWNWTDLVDDEFKNKIIDYFRERKEDG